MAFSNLFKKLKTTVGYDEYIKTKSRSFVTTHHLSAFRQIVAPFETEIPFRVVEKVENGDLKFVVEPTPEIPFLRTSSSGTPTTTAALFLWLDKGTNERHAIMPDEAKGDKSTFRNETFPGQLRTTHQDYIRNEIYVNHNIQRDGLEARNYSDLVQALYEDAFVKDTQGSLIDFIKNKFS